MNKTNQQSTTKYYELEIKYTPNKTTMNVKTQFINSKE